MAKRKHEVEVTLRAETTVRIAVWAEEDEDPSDLTPDEERAAINLAEFRARWEVESSRVVNSPKTGAST